MGVFYTLNVFIMQFYLGEPPEWANADECVVWLGGWLVVHGGRCVVTVLEGPAAAMASSLCLTCA